MGDVWVPAAVGLVALGVLGALRPGTPAAGLVFAGQALYAWATGFTAVDGGFLAGQLAVAALARVIDHFTGTPSAKRMAVPRPARVAALGGGVLGALTLGPLGTVVGPVAGALAGALAAGEAGLPTERAGCRAVAGFWFGVVTRIVIVVGMAAAFAARAL